MIFNKNLTVKFIAFVLITFLSLSAFINWLVDANDIFHNIKIEGFNKYKYKRTQNKVLYNATQNINKFDTIVFGTSRSAIYSSSDIIFKDFNIINLSDSIYGYPSRIYQYILNLVEKNHNIVNIFIGLDIHTMNTPKTGYAELRNYIFYIYPEFAYYLTKYYKLLPNSLPLTYRTIKNNLLYIKPKSYSNEFGVRYYNKDLNIYTKTFNNNINKFMYNSKELEYLTKIESLCKQSKINLVFFTFPYSIDYYDVEYTEKDIHKFINILPKYIKGYYNFTYKNKLTNNSVNYFNQKHHNHNFDEYLYNALILNKKSQKIEDKYIYKYIEKVKDKR